MGDPSFKECYSVIFFLVFGSVKRMRKQGAYEVVELASIFSVINIKFIHISEIPNVIRRL
jgi:hypothetical protein